MRKYMIGYGVWNKQDMIGWLLEGVGAHAPEVSHVRFVFDECDDASEANFDRMQTQILTNIRRTKHVLVSKMSSASQLREVGAHNSLLDYFVNHTDCDVLIVPQDDQRLMGPIILQVEALLNGAGERIGFIGGRDGFNAGLSATIGSQWSESELSERLAPGRWAERHYLNSGPMVYTRDLVAQVGMLDMSFECWYLWEDYCLRCRQLGLRNFVFGSQVRHLRFGTAPETTFYTNGSMTRDIARMRAKWPKAGW